MSDIDKLTEYFKSFPGVGPRQAKRFVYYLLRKNQNFSRELANLIPKIKQSVKTCTECQKYFTENLNAPTCSICSNESRNIDQLLVISRDTDLEAIEKSGQYSGYYFVLGGTVPVTEENYSNFIKIMDLNNLLEKKNRDLKEIILALSVNPDGENTQNIILKEIKNKYPEIKITILGRGLSTGSELEYADKDTLKFALENRS